MNFVLAFKAFFKALKGESSQIEAKAPPENSHLRLLTLLQKDGRLIDFLKEDISGFSDAQIGSAVRKIHEDCGKTLEEFVTLRPLFQEAEGAKVTVAQGYDSHRIKVVGKVKGAPPYQGILRHKGWIAHKLSLPAQIDTSDGSVVCPAEIEI